MGQALLLTSDPVSGPQRFLFHIAATESTHLEDHGWRTRRQQHKQHPRSSTQAWSPIPGGTFQMGSNHHYPEEAPAHEVTIGGFWMDRAPLTNAEFSRFVAAARHVTFAERPADSDD